MVELFSLCMSLHCFSFLPIPQTLQGGSWYKHLATVDEGATPQLSLNDFGLGYLGVRWIPKSGLLRGVWGCCFTA